MNVSDMQDFIGKAIRELSDSDATPDEMQQVIERAKAIGALTGQYVQLVRCEIDAAKVYSEHGVIPASVNKPVDTPIPQRPRLFGSGG